MEGNGLILERCYADINMDRLSRTTKQSSHIQCSGSDLNQEHSGQLEPEGYVKVSKHLDGSVFLPSTSSTSEMAFLC